MSGFLSKFLFIKNDRTLTVLNLYGIKKFFAVFILLVCFSFSSGSEEASWPFPVESVEDAVFMLEYFDPTGIRSSFEEGTAFIVQIKGKTYLVTNFHVIQRFLVEKTDWKITNKKGLVFNKKDIEGIAGLSFLYDLAVFKIQKKYKGPALKVSNKTEKNETAYSLGFPDGQFETIELNNVNELDPVTFSGLKRYNPISKQGYFKIGGASGGPVLNSKGEVIGVMVRALGAEIQFIKFLFVKRILRTNNSYGNVDSWFKNEMSNTIKLADEKNDPLAQFVIAMQLHYQYKSGLDKSYTPLLRYCERSAAQGHFNAQTLLGVIYTFGERDIPRNLDEAKKWLRLAAKQKRSIAADLLLAIVLTDEESSNRDFMEGFNLLKKLIDEGIEQARDFINIRLLAYAQRVSNDTSMTSTEQRDDGCTNGLFR